MDHDDEQILISAVRYCVGRQSYIVGSCDRWVRERWDSLSAGAQRVILDDLKAALDQERLGHRSLGMEMDRDLWAKLFIDLDDLRDLARAKS